MQATLNPQKPTVDLSKTSLADAIGLYCLMMSTRMMGTEYRAITYIAYNVTIGPRNERMRQMHDIFNDDTTAGDGDTKQRSARSPRAQRESTTSEACSASKQACRHVCIPVVAATAAKLQHSMTAEDAQPCCVSYHQAAYRLLAVLLIDPIWTLASHRHVVAMMPSFCDCHILPHADLRSLFGRIA